MKKLISMCLTGLMCLSITFPAIAAEEHGDLISFEEYISAIEREYDERKIEGAVYKPVEDFFCTPEMLEDDLSIIRESPNKSPVSFEDYEAAIVEEYAKAGIEGGVYAPEGPFYCTPVMLENDIRTIRKYIQTFHGNSPEFFSNPKTGSDEIEPQSMYIDVTCTNTTGRVWLNDPLLPMTATIETTATFQVDAQNDYIVSGGRPSLEVVSGLMIDDWIELISYSYDIDNTKHRVTATIVCKLKSSASLGVATSWAKFEDTYSTIFYPV